VGPGLGDTSWWANGAGDVDARSCFFDDIFRFNADGSFENVMGAETWLEEWQGAGADSCGAPVAPHNGSAAGTYSYNAAAATLTVDGLGAHIGLPKVVNGGEISGGAAVASSIVYEVTELTGNVMTLDINFGAGYWRFKLVPVNGGTGGGSTGGGTVATGAEGELTTNGDFEQGNLSGWELFQQGGTLAVSSTETNGGSWSGRISVGTGKDSLFKQANMAEGEVTPGQVLQISFDLKAIATGIGGVIFAEFFSEKTGGGVSNEGNSILGGGPIIPTGNWETHNYTMTAGSDVGAGVTLMLKALCGGDTCSVDAYFDNVSVAVAP